MIDASVERLADYDAEATSGNGRRYDRCDVMASGLRCNEAPAFKRAELGLKDDPEPELNSARIVRTDKGQGMALELVFAYGSETLQVIRTIEQVQCLTGVRDRQGLDRRKCVPDLVKVHPVEDVRPVRNHIEPDPSFSQNVQ